MTEKQGTEKRWHVAKWPPLAWLETAIKLAAISVGIFALTRALSLGGFDLPSGPGLAQLIVTTVLSLGLVAAIVDRIIASNARSWQWSL
jgi:hypothetical protein